MGTESWCVCVGVPAIMEEPLLTDPEQGQKDFVDELENFIDVYHKEKNDFKRHVDLALRASFVATIGSLVFILTEQPPNGDDMSYWRNKFSVVAAVGPCCCTCTRCITPSVIPQRLRGRARSVQSCQVLTFGWRTVSSPTELIRVTLHITSDGSMWYSAHS